MQWGGGGYGSAQINVTKVNSSTLAALRRGGLWVCQISGKKRYITLGRPPLMSEWGQLMTYRSKSDIDVKTVWLFLVRKFY